MRTNGWRAAATAVCSAIVVCSMRVSVARADVSVDWDCYLAEGRVGCQSLTGAYFHSLPGIARRASRPRAADVRIRARSVGVPSGVQYFVDFGDGAIAFTLRERIPASVDGDEALLRLVALLQRGTVPFVPIASPGKVEAGTLSLDAHDSSAPRDAREQSAGERWYVRPAASASVVSAGVTLVSIGAELELNYSDPIWRALGSASAQYRRLDFELGGQRLEGAFVSGRASLVEARSLGRGVSVALLEDGRREPQNNLETRGRAGAGIEWLDAPFLRANEGNFGARYRLLGVYDRYVAPNVLGRRELAYPRHELSLLVRTHAREIDLGLDVTGGAILDAPRYWDVGATASVTVRVGDALEVGANGSIVYRPHAVHAPLDAGALDPIATLVAGSDFGPLTYQAELSIAVALGNGLLRSQDQRWR